MNSNISSYLPKDLQSNPFLRAEYSPYALQQTRNILKNGIDDEAISRKYVEGISIDGAESKDLDDAIWAEKHSKGYRVYVHISDVTEAIKIYTPLDLEALKRTTSIYRPQKVLNMLPNELSQDILSLDENGEKLTLSMYIDLDFDGNIIDSDVFESKFKNLKRYDYDNFFEDFIDTNSNYHNELHLMYDIARIRRSNRTTSGADLDYDESDRRIFLGDKNIKEPSIHKGISKIIIEEFMILANVCAAQLLVKNNIDGIFRAHESELERAFYTSKSQMHVGLAEKNYTHFTSPIRRYSDDILHRVLKIVYLRGEKSPFNLGEINDICKHINISREIVDIFGNKLTTQAKINEEINEIINSGKKVNTSTFTSKIRGKYKSKSSDKSIPKAIKEQVIKDIKYGKTSDWAWCIGVFLLSKEEDIKLALFNKLINNISISPKSVLNILNETKIFDEGENRNLFNIEHLETENQYSIIFNFKGEKIFKISDNIDKNNIESKKGKLRRKAVKKIFSHFLNFSEQKINKKSNF